MPAGDRPCQTAGSLRRRHSKADGVSRGRSRWALTAQKIRGETLDHSSYITSAAALQVNSKQPRSGRKDRHTGTLSACFVSQRGTGFKNAGRWRKWVNAERNSNRHIAAFFAWIAATKQESAAEMVGFHARGAREPIIDLYVMTQGPPLHRLKRLHQVPSAR